MTINKGRQEALGRSTRLGRAPILAGGGSEGYEGDAKPDGRWPRARKHPQTLRRTPRGALHRRRARAPPPRRTPRGSLSSGCPHRGLLLDLDDPASRYPVPHQPPPVGTSKSSATTDARSPLDWEGAKTTHTPLADALRGARSAERGPPAPGVAPVPKSAKPLMTSTGTLITTEGLDVATRSGWD